MFDLLKERPSEQRVVLAAERFSSKGLEKLLQSDAARRYVCGIKIEPQTLFHGELHAFETIRDLCDKHGLFKIADVQLSGGNKAVRAAYVKEVKDHQPDIITIGFGMGRPVYEHLKDATPTNCPVPKILVTGVLPEVDPLGFEEQFRRPPSKYTNWLGVASYKHADGVYGAARYARNRNWDHFGQVYMGAGISLDGENYVEGETEKVALTASEAREWKCGMVVVGHAIASHNDHIQALEQIGEGIA